MLRCSILALSLALAPLSGAAQSDDEIAFAREFLDGLQLRSIIEDREYCGYFGRDEDGQIRATRPRRGKYNSCNLGTPPSLLRVVFGYHTHASYDPGSINEIPSLQDLQSDIDSGTNGFVSTPGGRLWVTDGKAQEARQLCGPGCLAQDPDFRPGKSRKVRRSYSLDDLQRIMGD